MNRSTPGLPVHHKPPEFTQTHAHRVGDAIQPSHHRLILMCSFYMTSFTYSKFYLFLIKTKCKNLYYHFLMLLFLSTILFGWREEPQWTSLVAQMVKNPPAMRKTWVWSLGWEESLEEGMTTHSSILAWRIHTDRGAWRATGHGVTKSQTKQSTAQDPKWTEWRELCAAPGCVFSS